MQEGFSSILGLGFIEVDHSLIINITGGGSDGLGASMHSANVLESGIAEQFVDASLAVVANNDELMRQATILVRLIKLMDGSEGHQDMDELVGRVARSLETHLGIYELYLRKDREALASSSLELEKALETREMLTVRREVGDIRDQEYSLKMAVADWGIDNYRAKTRELKSSVAAMSNLRDRFESEFIDDLGRLAVDDYRKIRGLGVGSELSEMIIGSFRKISESFG